MPSSITPVLDQGYVKYVAHMGSDESFIEAARMSVDSGFVSWEPYPGHPRGDAGLLAHLWHNAHTTPFEMGGLIIEVKAPIFVFREWMRHRTQGFNEMSGRYVPLPNENYAPYACDVAMRSLAAVESKNKQSRGVMDRVCTLDEARDWIENYLYPAYATAQRAYDHALNIGVPKELARLSTPVARYSRMRAIANPLNWMKFLTLRTPHSAQQEIRDYAEVVREIFAKQFPRTHALWQEGMELAEEFKAWKASRK